MKHLFNQKCVDRQLGEVAFSIPFAVWLWKHVDTAKNPGPQIVDAHNRCIHFLSCIEPDVFPRRCFVKAKMGAVLSILCGLIAFVINRIFSKGTGFHGNSDPDRLFCAHKKLQWNEIFQLILRYTQVFVVRCESFRSICHFSAGVPPLYIDLFGSQLKHQQKRDVFHCELWGKDPVEPKTPIIGLGGNEWWLIGVSYQIGRDKSETPQKSVGKRSAQANVSECQVSLWDMLMLMTVKHLDAPWKILCAKMLQLSNAKEIRPAMLID